MDCTILESSTEAAAPDGPDSADTAKRRQILEGARRVFLARGFDGASMGEIAKTAGVSKGTLYVYFDSKEALFEALTLQERGELAEALFSLDEQDPDVRAVLQRLGTSFLDMMVRPDHIASVRMVIGASNKFPRIGQFFYEAGPACGTSRLQAYLDRQVEAGRLSIADTARAASHFLDLCNSGILKRLLFAASGPPSQDDIATNVEVALAVFFAVYGPDADQSSSRKAAATRA